MKKIISAVGSVAILAASLSVNAAGQFGFEFSASNPQDQLAWVQHDDAPVLAVKTKAADKKVAKVDGGHWDPLGAVAVKGADSVALKRDNSKQYLTTVSAKKKNVEKSFSTESKVDNIWDMIH